MLGLKQEISLNEEWNPLVWQSGIWLGYIQEFIMLAWPEKINLFKINGDDDCWSQRHPCTYWGWKDGRVQAFYNFVSVPGWILKSW